VRRVREDGVKIIVTEDGVTLDSAEQALFYGLCILRGIPVECADGHWAPSFYLPSLNIWVEVSDSWGNPGWAAELVARGERLAVLRREELEVLMTRANASVVVEQLRIWARS
jgi:hypothetical protein